MDGLLSSSARSRVDDLHAAFSDPEVAGILTVIAGFSSNELLPYLDWELIAANRGL
jgi:muramoyltetrapeptide carboxypeptidase LdcA involved in peptidoglycan recycling